MTDPWQIVGVAMVACAGLMLAYEGFLWWLRRQADMW